MSYKVLGKKCWLYCRRGSLGGKMTKEGYGLIRMRAETVGIWKDGEAVWVGRWCGRDFGLRMFGGR